MPNISRRSPVLIGPDSGIPENFRGAAGSSALARRLLKRGTFRSIAELQATINRYLTEHNQTPKPWSRRSARTRSSPK